MARGLMGLMAVAAGMSVAACSADEESLPAAPSFHTITSSTTTCDFSHIKSIANKYFTGSQKKKVSTLATQMSQAGAYSTTAKNRGFDIMAEIASAVRTNQAGTPSRGSDLTNHLILCMFSRTSELDAYPLAWPEDFTVAVTPSLHGAYEVRGGPTDLTTPVLSRPLTAPFSGVAPLQTSTWPLMLDAIGTSNPPPNRILLYGQPGSTSTSYVWKMVPHNADFAPPAIVGLCTEDPNAMVTEDGAFLRFEDAYFLVPGVCSPTALLQHGWTPFRLARGLFSPRHLWAGSLNPGGLGGSTGGIRSEYGTEEVVVSLTLSPQPTDGTINQSIPPGDFSVSALSAGEPVPGTTVTLQAVENNGSTVLLTSSLAACTGDTCSAPVDANGVAHFGNLFINKTGGYRLAISAAVAGRPGLSVGITSNQFNIRP
jgi:hypothetical protein